MIIFQVVAYLYSTRKHSMDYTYSIKHNVNEAWTHGKFMMSHVYEMGVWY